MLTVYIGKCVIMNAYSCVETKRVVTRFNCGTMQDMNGGGEGRADAFSFYVQIIQDMYRKIPFAECVRVFFLL